VDKEKAFDEKVAAKLREIPVPADLRSRILAGRKVVPMRRRYSMPQLLSLAAVVAALLVAVGTLAPWRQGHGGAMASADYDRAVLPFLGTEGPTLGMASPDHREVLAWLKERNSPVARLPSAVTPLPSLGCQVYSVQGHTVSLICFTLPNGKEAHLFVVKREDLSDPPGSSPQFAKMGAWTTAAWSEGDTSYLLATQAEPEALKELL